MLGAFHQRVLPDTPKQMPVTLGLTQKENYLMQGAEEEISPSGAKEEMWSAEDNGAACLNRG